MKSPHRSSIAPDSRVRVVGACGRNPSERSSRLSLDQYFSALRRRWFVLLALAALGATVAFGVARSTPPTYKATAKIFVTLSNGQTSSDLVQGSTFVKNLVESYAALT